MWQIAAGVLYTAQVPRSWQLARTSDTPTPMVKRAPNLDSALIIGIEKPIDQSESPPAAALLGLDMRMPRLLYLGGDGRS